MRGDFPSKIFWSNSDPPGDVGRPCQYDQQTCPTPTCGVQHRGTFTYNMWVRSVVSTVALVRVCKARKTMYGLTPVCSPSVILANASSRLMLKVWTSDIGPSSRQKMSGDIAAVTGKGSGQPTAAEDSNDQNDNDNGAPRRTTLARRREMRQWVPGTGRGRGDGPKS